LFWFLIGAILAIFFAIVCSAIDWLQQAGMKRFSQSRSDPTFVNRCRTVDTSNSMELAISEVFSLVEQHPTATILITAGVDQERARRSSSTIRRISF
jgi:hypothetical protein